ncbi:MAG TPA: nuclear transport factor 2 family protein [Gaiellaceae bacterium]|jgi:ketosteroid isomerase-like protein
MNTRAQRLADLNEIRELKSRYCRFVDGGYPSARDDSAAFADLFAPDGVWETGGEPTVGRDAIRERAASSRRFRFHLAANPIVDVDGDRAQGLWHVLVAVTGSGGAAAWLAGRYADELVRTADGWRFAAVRFEAAFHAPYDVGWSPQ